MFRVSPDGKEVQLLTTDLKGPNGLAFSPDEKYFYVDNWDEKKKIIMRYEVNEDGTLSNGKVFFDMTGAPGEDALDGMKIDERGNLYVSGPGGLWIISPEGKQLGTIVGPEHPHDMAWGDDDGKTPLSMRPNRPIPHTTECAGNSAAFGATRAREALTKTDRTVSF